MTTHHRIREHFLTKLFALARLREVGETGRLVHLVAFHAMYKFLLLAYSERELRELGWVVANPMRERFDTVGKYLTREERRHFSDQLKRYREGQLAASAIALLLESWAVRFGSAYMLDQALFALFPEALASPADSGKGRAAGR